MKNEKLSFDEAYDVAQRENIDMIHEQAMAENEQFNIDQKVNEVLDA
jgi:hypothetical protein